MRWPATLAALTVAAGLAAAPALAAPSCYVPGATALLASPSTRFILVGETHGTEQSPAEFGALVCDLAKRGRQVVVGFEHPQADQGALDRFLASDGGMAAKLAFTSGGDWVRPFTDGRTSQAMLALIERLRGLRRSGQVVDVRYIVSPAGDGPGEAHERSLARGIDELASFYPGALVVILMGEIHASRRPVSFGDLTYNPAAMWLPQPQLISLLQINGQGRSWNCIGQAPSDCGAHDAGNDQGPRGVRLIPVSGIGRYDGILASGAPATASPPAVRWLRPGPGPR